MTARPSGTLPAAAPPKRYHTRFDSWEFQRGQESDVWYPLVDLPEPPPFHGRNSRPYWANREFIDTECDEDYPTPQCFLRAIEFLENNHETDNWHLHLEVFDPHEPFACPSQYREMYADTWEADLHFDWPAYAPVEEDAAAVEHIRKSYAGTLTMADAFLGKLLAPPPRSPGLQPDLRHSRRSAPGAAAPRRRAGNPAGHPARGSAGAFRRAPVPVSPAGILGGDAIMTQIPQLRVDSVRKVFDDGLHDAFTDLCRFQGRLYLTCRSCPDGHMVFASTWPN